MVPEKGHCWEGLEEETTSEFPETTSGHWLLLTEQLVLVVLVRCQAPLEGCWARDQVEPLVTWQ